MLCFSGRNAIDSCGSFRAASTAPCSRRCSGKLQRRRAKALPEPDDVLRRLLRAPQGQRQGRARDGISSPPSCCQAARMSRPNSKQPGASPPRGGNTVVELPFLAPWHHARRHQPDWQRGWNERRLLERWRLRSMKSSPAAGALIEQRSNHRPRHLERTNRRLHPRRTEPLAADVARELDQRGARPSGLPRLANRGAPDSGPPCANEKTRDTTSIEPDSLAAQARSQTGVRSASNRQEDLLRLLCLER